MQVQTKGDGLGLIRFVDIFRKVDSMSRMPVSRKDYIEVFYHPRRRHSTLGQISPADFERRFNAA